MDTRARRKTYRFPYVRSISLDLCHLLTILHLGAILLGNANDAASRASTSVASLLGFLVASLSEVISAGMDDNGTLEGSVSYAVPERFTGRLGSH